MNNDIKTEAYLKKLENLRLSESSRARIQNDLLEYARFHPVRSTDVRRSIEQVPSSTFLHSLKFSTMPIALFLALFVSVGTSFAAQGAVPGDFLYPVKTGVNENIRAAFAVGVNAEARYQADLLAERLEEAETLNAEGKLDTNTAAMISATIDNQVDATIAAIAKSDTDVAAEVNASVRGYIEQFLVEIGTDSVLASNVSASLNATFESQGTISSEALVADMKLRVATMQELIEKYEGQLDTQVRAELKSKLEAAALLTIEAESKAEVEAQSLLNEALVLTGEVESKLSTLGQVEVDSNTGIITDIDFSIDPMILTPEDINSSNDDPAEFESDVQIDVDLNGAASSNVIEADVSLEATSVIGL